MSTSTSSLSIFTTVPVTMSPSLKGLIVASMAAINSSWVVPTSLAVIPVSRDDDRSESCIDKTTSPFFALLQGGNSFGDRKVSRVYQCLASDQLYPMATSTSKGT